MNDFERRALDLMLQSNWLASVARKDQKILDIDTYSYNVNIDAIAAAGNGQNTVQIQSDSDFVLTYMSGAVINDGTAAVVTNPNVTIQITDTGTGKTFFSAVTLFPLVFGSGGLPYYLPSPRVLAPNTNINVSATNNTAATSSVKMAFLGARIYYGG